MHNCPIHRHAVRRLQPRNVRPFCCAARARDLAFCMGEGRRRAPSDDEGFDSPLSAPRAGRARTVPQTDDGEASDDAWREEEDSDGEEWYAGEQWCG